MGGAIRKAIVVIASEARQSSPFISRLATPPFLVLFLDHHACGWLALHDGLVGLMLSGLWIHAGQCHSRKGGNLA